MPQQFQEFLQEHHVFCHTAVHEVGEDVHDEPNNGYYVDGHTTYLSSGCSPKRFRAQSRVREIQPSTIALQNLTFTSPTTGRRLSHFRRPSQLPPQYQCLLLSAKSDALSNCLPKAFVAASEITLLMQLRKLFSYLKYPRRNR